MMAVDGRVPGYLGRVLDDGAPVGTCFQISSGVLATAWHVLDDIGAADEDATVEVDLLAGGSPFEAKIVRIDPLRDLAVLTCDTVLPEVAGALAVTDQLTLRTLVHVTGHSVPEDGEHIYRFLDAPGEWAGGTTRDDAVPLGRMTSNAVVPGMSGAPVIRDSDRAVVGVVSGRYNSADNWLAGTVWVARAEDLAILLHGIAEVRTLEVPLAGPADVLLTVTSEQVELTGPGLSVAAAHHGVRPGLAEAVNDIRRERGRAGLPIRADTETVGADEGVSLDRVGRLLGESFLPDQVGAKLGEVLAAAERAHQPVRFGLRLPPELAGLPWEALPRPDGRGPLALDPLVSVYRQAEAAPTRRLPGPIRIVVAIASPDADNGPVLDYERELRNVLAAVRVARQDAADVRVVPFATAEAIRAELDRGLAHVLHISGHGSPGQLYLERQDGSVWAASAEEFLAKAIPPGKMPPVITLSACYSDAAASNDGASFAAQLCQHGAAAVIATEASITDTYATRLLARVYGTLAQASDPDVIVALAEARRQVQIELATSPDPRDHLLSGLGEWAAVTVLAATGYVPVLDLQQSTGAVGRPLRPRIAGLADRDDWYFVGRRPEQRQWPTELTTSGSAGIVICGMGGTGKTTLAAELVGRVHEREPSRILVSLSGPLTLEGLLGVVTSEIRRRLLVSGAQDTTPTLQALGAVARADVGWQDRFAILRQYVLDQVPVLVLLDNFEDNLHPEDDTGYTVTDEVLGGLLADWAAHPGLSRLLITSRYQFALPGAAERSLSFRQLGALSRAETMKLAWSLPALDRLDDTQLEQVWLLAGGHPRSLEYLDALLSGGHARYPDVTERLNAAIDRQLSGAELEAWLEAASTGLDAALSETVALAADDVLLDDLLTRLNQVSGAVSLLLGVSVYREPVDMNAVLFQAGDPDPEEEHIPDRSAAYEQITQILASAGIAMDESLDLANVPASVQVRLEPHVAELNRRAIPPFHAPIGLDAQIAACRAASLLTTVKAGEDARFFVHRWTATELARRAASEPDEPLTTAHRQAAAYWVWRVRVWPQDRAADVHDLLEARHHLLQAGETEEFDQVTEEVVRRLDESGAWDQEASIVHDTLARASAESVRQADWIHQLGVILQHRGDYDEAARHYQRALTIYERHGDQAGMAASDGQLGILTQQRGDYDEAARHYQRALAIHERLDDQAGMATGYHQLGVLAQLRGDYDEAARQIHHAIDIYERLGNQTATANSYGQLGILAEHQGGYDEAARHYQRALAIHERLGNQAGMASTYHNLGILAQDQGDYDEAARQYQRSLDIKERLGNQAGMATSYHQLGVIAQRRGDYEEAARQLQRSLDIEMRLGNQAGIATSYHQLGILAQERGDHEEAARQYQRSLDVNRRLGNQSGMAATYHQLGILAQERGDDEEAARQYHRAFDIYERHGDQAGMAAGYGQLGALAQGKGDYDEAARLYHRALDICERLNSQVGMAFNYSRLGILEAGRGGKPTTVIACHVNALVIRLRLGVPEVMIDLRRLAAYRREIGGEAFASLLLQVVGDVESSGGITSLIDQVDAAEGDIG